MASIEINLPDHVNETEARIIENELGKMLNSHWELFKINAKAFFDSLKAVLGDIWKKIANWARDFWNRIFG